MVMHWCMYAIWERNVVIGLHIFLFLWGFLFSADDLNFLSQTMICAARCYWRNVQSGPYHVNCIKDSELTDNEHGFSHALLWQETVSSCWISWDSHWPISLVCQGPSEWQQNPMVYLSATSPSFVSSANLLTHLLVHSIPLPRTLTKRLNSTSPSANPWGTPPMTGLLLDFMLLITSLWIWQFS